MATTITTKEQSLLAAIINNEFHDGRDPVDDSVWVNTLDGWSGEKSFPGVMASLVRKGFAKTNGESCSVTQAGYEVFVATNFTPAQRATIDELHVEITYDKGCVIFTDPLAAKHFGLISGVRSTTNIVRDAEKMLRDMEKVHALAVAKDAEPQPQPTPGPAPVVRKQAAQAQGAVAGAPGPKKGGVIASLLRLLGDGNKRTKAELYEALVAEYPDRASETGGMRVTISVQLKALQVKGHNIVSCASDRGTLFYIVAQ